MPSPKISVVIPMYNSGPYIAEALDSVLAQTVQDFEIIVVNDGSTDDGAKIVEEYADYRITLINQKNGGEAAARNRGIRCAKADIIAFLDSDDQWFPPFLETILILREKYPQAGAYATGIVEIQNEKESYPTYQSIPNDEYDGIINFFRGRVIGERFVTSSSVAIKTAVLTELSGFREGFEWGIDSDLWGRIALKYPIAYNNKICSRYIIRNPQQKLERRVSVTKEHPFITTGADFLATVDNSWDNYEYLEKFLDKLRILSARYNLMIGNSASAREILLKCGHQDYFIEKFSLLPWTYCPEYLYKYYLSHLFRFGISCIVIIKRTSRALNRIARVR